MTALPPEHGSGIPTPEPGGQSLTTRTLKSFMWAGASYGAGKLVVFVSTLILARILVPESFGVVAAGLTFIEYLRVVLDLGVGAAVIYEQERGITERVQTAFTLNLLVAIVLAAAGFFASPWIAEFFGIGDEADIFRVLSLALIISGAGKVSDSVLQRDLDFKKRAVVDIARAVVRAGVAIVLAFEGFGAWALVWGYVAGEVAFTATAWTIVHFVPKLKLQWEIAKSLLNFGVLVTLTAIVDAVASNGDYIVVGHLLGPVALGFYVIAYRMPELILESIYWVSSSIVFPAYSQAREADPDKLRVAILRALRLLTLYGFSVGVGLALVSRDVVLVFYGPEWADSVTAMAILSLTMGLRALSYGIFDVFPAVGKPGVSLWVYVPEVAIQITAMVFVADHGLAAIAFVLLVVGLAGQTAGLILAKHYVRFRWSEVAHSVRPGVAASAGIVVFGIAPRLILAQGWVSLVIIIVAGSIGGVCGLLVASRDTFGELRELARHVTSRNGHPDATDALEQD